MKTFKTLSGILAMVCLTVGSAHAEDQSSQGRMQQQVPTMVTSTAQPIVLPESSGQMSTSSAPIPVSTHKATKLKIVKHQNNAGKVKNVRKPRGIGLILAVISATLGVIGVLSIVGAVLVLIVLPLGTLWWSVTVFAALAGVLSIILGVVSLATFKPGERGRGVAIAGIVLGFIGFGLFILVLLALLAFAAFLFGF